MVYKITLSKYFPKGVHQEFGIRKKLFQEHLDDDEKKPLSEVVPYSGTNYHEGKVVYNSGSDLYRIPFRIFYVIPRGWSSVPPLFKDNF